MTKLEEWLQKEIKMDIIPETEIVLTPFPWLTTEALDAKTSIKNINGADVKFYQDDTDIFEWAFDPGDFTITVWFRPKRIDIKSVIDWNNEWASLGTVIINEDNELKNWCIYVDWSFTNQWRSNNDKSIVIQWSSVQLTAFVSSITSTWFVITVDNNNWRFTPIFTVEG